MMATMPAMHQKVREGTGSHNEEWKQRNNMLAVPDDSISRHNNRYSQQEPAAIIGKAPKHFFCLPYYLFISVSFAVCIDLHQILVVRRRSELPMTLTDESAMAAAAIMGESSSPNVG
jgi:hypothetical protein